MPSRREFIAATFAAFASSLGAATNPARPYLQSLSESSATLVWMTLDARPASLEFGPAGALPQPITPTSRFFAPQETGLPHGLWLHEAKLTGLLSQTTYRYHSSGTPAAAFRTPGSGRSRIVVFGDSGTETDEQRQLATRMTARQPDLILHTGDLVYPVGDAGNYLRKYYALYQELFATAPAFPCAGNHDYYHAGGQMFVEFNKVPRDSVPVAGHGRYYSFDWENAHIVVLDSNTPLEEAAAGRGEMLEWLERDLAATTAYWRIAMFHHPPYAGGPNQEDPLSELVRQHIVPILERHHVDLVFSGHEHNYQRSHPINGIVYLTSGGGGASIYPPIPRAEAAVQHARHHFLEAELTATSLRVDAIDVDGHLLDTLTLKPPPRILSPLLSSACGTAAVAVGGLATIMGRSFSAVVRVHVNGQPAVVIYSNANQINVRLPDGIIGPAHLQVETSNGQAELTCDIARTAPAIFAGAVFTANGRRITALEPAQRGGRLSVYFTGRGSGEQVTARLGDAVLDVYCESQAGIDRADFTIESSGEFVLVIDGVTSNAIQIPVA